MQMGLMQVYYAGVCTKLHKVTVSDATIVEEEEKGFVFKVQTPEG